MFRNLPILEDHNPSGGGWGGTVRSDANEQREIVVTRLRERKRLQSMGTPEDMFVVLRGGAVIQGKLLRFDESNGTVIVWETTRSCKMHFHISDIAAIS
ncbi:MAG TPA: hypothetical protein VLB83_05050 [Candidatus Paceibacterota bacterium]|nr:hypothetical protein [Candidatus Paceibacterota bacterium]